MRYTTYWHKIHTKWKPFQEKQWKWYPTPGCIQHRKIIGEERGRRIFLHYVELPYSACKLYWKTHPDVYKQMLESNE